MPVTLEKTAAGLLQSLLFGLGRDAIKEAPIIAENGAQIYQKGFPWWRRMTVGERPLDVLKQRLVQGGIAGKGGLLHGAMAFSPEVLQAKEQGGMLNALKRHPLDVASTAANNSLVFGLPALAAGKHFLSKDPVHATKSLSEIPGWAIGMPFGLPGALIANQVSNIGESAAKSYFKPEPPRINLNDAYKPPEFV